MFKLFIIAVLSIILAGVVLYFRSFFGSDLWVKAPRNKHDIIFGFLLTYAIALISSAFLLWFFNRFEDIALYGMVAETVTLSFPSALGASAGRLLIQQEIMDDQNKKNWLERIVLWISAILVASTLLFLIYHAITDESTSPDIEVIYGSMEPKGKYYALQVTVKNHETQTAENVYIEITTAIGDKAQKAVIEF